MSICFLSFSQYLLYDEGLGEVKTEAGLEAFHEGQITHDNEDDY